MTTCGMHLATQPHRIAVAAAPMATALARAAHLAAVPAQCAAPQPSESRPIIMKAVTAEAEATQDYSTAA